MNFAEIKKKVLEKTPLLKKTLENEGTHTLRQHFENNLAFSHDTTAYRKEELLSIVKRMIIEHIDATIAETAIEQLRNHYYVSTADHHGPITHPFFVNSHLIQSFANQKKQLANIFVFSCGGVSLNNSSLPRSILFHDRDLTKNRYNFVSLKYRTHPVFSFPAYTIHEITSRLEKQQLPIQLKRLITDIYTSDAMLNATSYADQITHSNYLLWKKIPGQEKTNLIYLEQEDIVNRLLIMHHLDTYTPITNLLTDHTTIQIFKECFDGIQGAFSSHTQAGTILFWAIHNGVRKRLKYTKGKLESDDGTYQLILNPHEIKVAIEKKELMPSMALSYIILSFYYGLTCGGGFLQIQYLTYLKNAYLKLLNRVQKNDEMQNIEHTQTDYFCGEFVFGTLKNSEHTAHASSIDLILYGNENTDNELQEFSGVCTLGEAVDQMMPNFYKILYGLDPKVRLPDFYTPPSLYV